MKYHPILIKDFVKPFPELLIPYVYGIFLVSQSGNSTKKGNVVIGVSKDGVVSGTSCWFLFY